VCSLLHSPPFHVCLKGFKARILGNFERNYSAYPHPRERDFNPPAPSPFWEKGLGNEGRLSLKVSEVLSTYPVTGRLLWVLVDKCRLVRRTLKSFDALHPCYLIFNEIMLTLKDGLFSWICYHTEWGTRIFLGRHLSKALPPSITCP